MSFRGTVTSVDIGNTGHPSLRWLVQLKVDKVISGPSPGPGFWFAIHSPSHEGVEVGQRYGVTAIKIGDTYEQLSYRRID